MARLTIKDENGAERIHELVDDVTVIGRASGNTIQISDEKASRQHCRIEKDREKGFYRLVDLGSTNGTKVNGRKETSILLRKGDIITIGRTTFTYEGPGPEPEPKAEAAAGEKPAEEGPKYVVEIVEGAGKGKVFALAEFGSQAITIGRHSSNLIRVEDEAASNYHAEITKEPMGYVLADLSSTNGTRVKAPGQAEFERIVKTPLVPGMLIRIGKTILEYKNVGKPVEEDRILATVALDTDRLADRLKEKKTGAPRTALFAAFLLALFAGTVYGVAYLAGGRSDGDGKKPDGKDGGARPPAVAAVSNPSFHEGVEDFGGAPKGWRIIRSDPKVAVGVDAGQDCNPEAQVKSAVVIRKSQDSPPGTITCIETMDDLEVRPDTIYTVGAAMKNEGDGVFGVRMVWIRGNRRLTSLIIAKSGLFTNWDSRGVDIRPPAWAERARIQLFASGRDGKTYFDDVKFAVKGRAGGEAKEPGIQYEGVKVAFEDAAGAFRVLSGGQEAIENGTLSFETPDGQSSWDLSLGRAEAPEVSAEKVSLKGQIFDFVMQDWTPYSIEGSGGAAGVAMKFGAQRSVTGAGSRPSLRFDVVAPVSQGDIEATTGAGTEKIPPTQARKLSGVRELLFNADRSPQLCVSFRTPVEVSMHPRGNRRAVSVGMGEELEIEFSRISAARKHQAEEALARLTDTRMASRWADACKAFEDFEKRFGPRFPEMLENARRQMAEIRNRAAEAERECADLTGRASRAGTEEAIAQAKKALDAAIREWTGTPWEAGFRKLAIELDAAAKSLADATLEKEARELLEKARGFMKEGQEVPQVAQAFLKKLLDDRKYAATKAAQDAREELIKVERLMAEQSAIEAADKRIRAKIKNYEAAQDWAGAVRAIEKDPDYQKYGAKLPEIKKLLEEFRKKAGL
ncbi:MAG: FHA domain-containing protein [Planctomycetota bacterium]|nr:FHA domain-containing protein [Planctomycetota bacterium]